MSETRAQKPFKIFLAALAANLVFALMNVLIKKASVEHSIPQIVFFRSALGLVPIIVMVMMAGGLSLLKTSRPGGHFWRCLVGTTSMGFWFLSFHHLPLANTQAIISVSPLILTLLSIPLLGEKVGVHRLVAVGIGLMAVVYMLQPEYVLGTSLIGNVSALLAAVLSAFAMIFIRRLGRTEHHLTIVFYFTLFGTLASAVLLPFGFWQTPSPLMLVYLMTAGILGGIGQIFLTYAYAKGPAAFVSAFSYSGIVFGALMDWIVWHHVIDGPIAIGSTIITATGLYVLHREAMKRKRPSAESLSANE